MLTKIKSVLAGISPAHSPETSPAQTPSAVEAQVALKQKELSQGKTEKQVTRLTADVEAATLALTQAEQDLGDCVVNGRDTTAVSHRCNSVRKHSVLRGQG